jgi:acyl-coenzyme A thioesterase PaaI-like protein
MNVQTHRQTNARLCGRPLTVGDGRAIVELLTVSEMSVDARGLVHGGFVFGQADYAAMLAVNHPNVVLGAAQMRFLKPVRVGERIVARAHVVAEQGHKREVEVSVERDSDIVLSARMSCYVLPQHVLEETAVD